MNRTILFSPLGMTDSIRYFRDGAMLNIIRNYSPDIVYLYMSKEICKIHEDTNKYLFHIEKLSEILGKKIEVHVIKRPELIDVQIFDSFIDEFSRILNDIHKDYPDSKMLLNVSSGTPAMKSSLQILSLTLDFDTLPIQVSTPLECSNPRIDEEKDLTPEEQWELNESNDEEDNRCVESTTENLLQEFKKQSLIKLIRSYDYAAAYELAKDDSMLDKSFIELLSAANSRLKLEYGKTVIIFNKYGYKKGKLSPNKDFEEIYEYLLLLSIKVKKEEYADFIRAVTPVIAKIFELYLKNKCFIDISLYTKTDRNNVVVWDLNKLKDTKILDCFNKKYISFKESFVNSDSLCELICNFGTDSAAAKLSDTIREKIEKGIRNSAAHSIISVTDDIIRKSTGFSSEEILKTLYRMFSLCGMNVQNDPLRVYDEMNDFIIEKL